MTEITIPLTQGKNYISFPALPSPFPTYNFRTIFTSSGTINDIGTDPSGNKMFYRYDPMLGNYVLIDIDTEYIEEGKGYYLYITSISPHNIVYEGTEYSITFDQFKSKIIKGWNLLGVGKDAIVPTSWCKILDPITDTQVVILKPTKSYMVNYDECTVSEMGFESMIVIMASALVSFEILKEFKVL